MFALEHREHKGLILSPNGGAWQRVAGSHFWFSCDAPRWFDGQACRVQDRPLARPRCFPASINALSLATPIAARPHLVMRSASAPEWQRAARRDFFDQSITQRFACHIVGGAAFAAGRKFREFASVNPEKRVQYARYQERVIRTKISFFSCRGPQHFQRSAPSHLNKNTARLQSMPLSKNVTAPP
jgi:hypothetical protein